MIKFSACIYQNSLSAEQFEIRNSGKSSSLLTLYLSYLRKNCSRLGRHLIQSHSNMYSNDKSKTDLRE